MKINFKIKILFITILFFGFFGLAKSSWAATYYVSPSGTASWSQCTNINTPCPLTTANQNAVSGDTVYLRGGAYALTSSSGCGNDWTCGIEPKNLGTASARITFSAYPDETPIITSNGTAPSYTHGISIHEGTGNGVGTYIHITGITFHNLPGYAHLYNFANDNEIDHCTFSSDTGEDANDFGLTLNSMCNGGSSWVCYSKNNWIHHNTFSKNHEYGNQSCHEGNDMIRIGSGYSSTSDNQSTTEQDDYNTVEYNTIEYAGHALMDTYGGKNVIRGNIMHNESWITDYSGGTCTYPPMPNGKYGHRGLQTSEDYARLHQQILVEGNRFGFSSANPNNPGEANYAITSTDTIVRYNYSFGAHQSGIGTKWYAATDDYNTALAHRGQGGYGPKNIRIYNNTTFWNGQTYPYMQSSQPGCSTCPGKLAGINVYDAALNVIVKNNIAYNNYSYTLYGYDITVDSGRNPADYPSAITEVNNWETPNGDPKFVNPNITDPTSATLPNLTLQSSSGAINGGTYLTIAMQAGKNSTTLTVADAMYFQDGTWGSDLARGVTLFPDWIAIGSVNNTAQISSINYSTNTITLASPMTWNIGDKIWLYKDSSGKQVLYGSAPDEGAYEYSGDNDTTPPAAPSGLSVQ